MRFVVCLKQVPSTETKVRISSETGFVDTSDVEWVINPYDEYAIETALRLREVGNSGLSQTAGSTVTVVSLGPERVKTALRTALAMGADAAVHVWDDAFAGVDALAVGRVLAAAIRREPFDIVFCGKQAIDDDQAAVPFAIAHFLGVPHVSVVPSVSVEASDTGPAAVVAHREVEGATEIVHLKTPCLITVQKGKYEPRYPTLKLMMAAKKKEIPWLGAAELGIETASLTRRLIQVGDQLPPGRKPGRILEGEPAVVVSELVRRLREEAKVI